MFGHLKLLKKLNICISQGQVMITSTAGRNLIKKFESLRLTGYLDAIGIPTIGYGTTIMEGREVRVGEHITEEEAERFFAKDLAKFENFVRDLVTVPLTQPQFDALVSFTYNLGPTNLRKSTLLRLLNSGRIKEAQGQFLRWNRAGGKVLKGLTRRRLAEAVLFGPLSAEQLIAMYKLVV
jgi:lysozyme